MKPAQSFRTRTKILPRSADFVIRTDGVCRVNPEMARMVVAEVSA